MTTIAKPYIDPTGRAVSDPEIMARMQAIRNAGYTGEFGGGKADAWLTQKYGSTATPVSPANPYQNGVVPLSAEPLHEFEKNALSQIGNPGMLGGGGMVQGQDLLKQFNADPQAFSARFINPNATKYMEEAAGAYRGGMAPVGESDIQRFMNPFQQQVIDSSMARLSNEGERARAAVLKNAGQRGSAGFAGTMTGTQLGEQSASLTRDKADLESRLRYGGFSDAVGQANTERGRMLQAGQGFGNLGTQTQGLTTSGANLGVQGAGQLFDSGVTRTNQGYNTLDRMLNAGGYIRNYNQNLANMAEEDIMAEGNYPYQQASNTLALLNGVQSGGTAAQQPYYQPNRAGGIVSGIGGVVGQVGSFLNGQEQLPWTTAGNVNPQGGFY